LISFSLDTHTKQIDLNSTNTNTNTKTRKENNYDEKIFDVDIFHQMTSDSSSKPPNSVNSVDEYLNLTGQNTQTESGNGYESNLLNKNNSQMIFNAPHTNTHSVQSPALCNTHVQHHHHHHNHLHQQQHHVEDMKIELNHSSSHKLIHETQTNNNTNIIKNEMSDTKNIDDLARQFRESTQYVQQNSVTNSENQHIVNRNQFESSSHNINNNNNNNNNNSTIDLSSQKSISFNHLKPTTINHIHPPTVTVPSSLSSSSSSNYIQYLNDPKHLVHSQFTSSSSSSSNPNLVHHVNSNNEMVMIQSMSVEKSNETKTIPILIGNISENFSEKNEKITDSQFLNE
jgi:hypothetical protein